jgi:site-specific recombinase XerD
MKVRANNTQKIFSSKGERTVSNLALVADPTQESDPFRQFISEWLDAGRADGLSPRTLEDYHDKIYKYWWWRTHDARYADMGGQHPQSVTRKEARDYAIYLRNSQKVRWGELVRPGKETLSPASVASYGRVVKVFFAWLITEGYIDDDPFAGKGVSFNTKHKEARVVKVVDAGDLEKIFNYLMNSNRLQYYNGPRNLAIIALLTDSGIRRGELLGLKVDDFDLENNRCIVNGKTGERWVHFSEACRVAIKGYFNMREIWHQGIYPEMWLTDESQPLGYHGFSVMITRLRNATSVNFHAHSLRHTFATTLASQGIDLFALKALLGHASISTTQIYVNQNTETLARAYAPHSPLKNMERIDKALRSTRGRPRRNR